MINKTHTQTHMHMHTHNRTHTHVSTVTVGPIKGKIACIRHLLYGIVLAFFSVQLLFYECACV